MQIYREKPKDFWKVPSMQYCQKQNSGIGHPLHFCLDQIFNQDFCRFPFGRGCAFSLLAIIEKKKIKGVAGGSLSPSYNLPAYHSSWEGVAVMELFDRSCFGAGPRIGKPISSSCIKDQSSRYGSRWVPPLKL